MHSQRFSSALVSSVLTTTLGHLWFWWLSAPLSLMTGQDSRGGSTLSTVQLQDLEHILTCTTVKKTY